MNNEQFSDSYTFGGLGDESDRSGFVDTIISWMDMNESTIQGAYNNYMYKYPSYFMAGTLPDGTPVEADKPRPTQNARQYLIRKGFDEAEVDEFLAAEAERERQRELDRLAREAYQKTRRYKVLLWLRVRRDRVRDAWLVLTGEASVDDGEGW
jgi:hypothetical protein